LYEPNSEANTRSWNEISAATCRLPTILRTNGRSQNAEMHAMIVQHSRPGAGSVR
jgi:hypothetical protein